MLPYLVNILFRGEFVWFHLQDGQNWETMVWINHTILSREIRTIHWSYDCYQLFFISYKCNVLCYKAEYLQFPSYLMPIRFSVFLVQYAVWLTHLFFIPFGLENSKLLIILYLVHSVLCTGYVFVFLPCVSILYSEEFCNWFSFHSTPVVLMHIFPCMIIIV